MDFWTHLGIEKTKDIEAINAAYHKKLPLVNPEDKPEEFKALRSEYEEALRFAKQQQEQEKPEGELTPVERWTKRLDGIYSRIADRCDPSQWKELLSDPLFESLDYRADLFDALMTFLMDRWHIPQEIWQLLDDAFDLRERKDELTEKYPNDFINDAVISGIENKTFVPYELFLPQNTGDIDSFFSLYFKARDEVLSGDLDSAQATLSDLDTTGITHPFADMLRLRLQYQRTEGTVAPDDVLAGAKDLYEKYPEQSELAGFYADMVSTRGDNDTAIAIYDSILEKDPENNNMRYHKAQSLMESGNYKDAKKLLSELNEAIPFNATVRAAFNEANRKLLEQYAASLKEHPDDFENRLEYAWCLFQNDEEPKALDVMDVPPPEELPQRCDYENILSKLYQCSGNPEAALKHAQAWSEAVAQLPEGETEEEKRRKNKANDIALVESSALYDMKRYEEALQKTEEAIAADPKEIRGYHERYLACNALHDYNGALKACEEMIRLKPSGMTYHLLGRAQYILGMMQDSFNSFGEALDYSKDASSYIYRAKILIMYDQYDDAQELIDLLKENEINTEGVQYCESLILSERDDKEDEAKAIWQNIIDRDAKGECDCELLWEVYTDMAVYMLRHEADPNEILAVIDRGLQARDDYSPLLMNKGYILDEKLDRHEEGLEIYRKVYEQYPRHNSVCERMAGIYYYDLHDVPTALSFYQQQAERADNTFCEVMLGNCLSDLEKFDESDRHFKTAIELDGDYERAYRNYCQMLMRARRYDEALAVAQKVEEMVGDRHQGAKRLVAQVLARMGRYADAAAIHIQLYEKHDNISDIDAAADMLLTGGLTDLFLDLLRQHRIKLGDLYFTQMADYTMATGSDSKWLKNIQWVSTGTNSRNHLLANYYYRHGDWKKALKSINQYYAADPDSIMGRFIPIECRRHMGQTEGLDALFEEGMRILERENTPNYQPLYLTKKAYMLIAMGRYDEAKACIDKAFQSPLCEHCRFRGCVDGYDALAQYFDATGDYNSAVLACMEGQKLSPYDPDLGERIRRMRKEHKKELNKELQK